MHTLEWQSPSASCPKRPLIAMLLLFVSLGLTMTRCSTQQALRPAIVVVDNQEIRPGDEPETWVVSNGWMLKRMEYEKNLKVALDRCESRN